MYQATLFFRQTRECPLDVLLDEFDHPFEIEVEEVSDNLVTFILHSGTHTESFLERLSVDEHIEHIERLDDEALLITKPSCGAYTAIYQNHGTLRRDNTVGGTQRVYNVLFFRREDLKSMIADLRELGTVSLGSLEEVGNRQVELTDRQRSVITHALEAGYYEWPREVKSEVLAAELGISRATLHEHLRKAERKLIADSLDYERLSGQADAPVTKPRT